VNVATTITVNIRRMYDALKAERPIVALDRRDPAGIRQSYGMGVPEFYVSLWVVATCPGYTRDGRGIGWSVARPFGLGAAREERFKDWLPLLLTACQCHTLCAVTWVADSRNWTGSG